MNFSRYLIDVSESIVFALKRLNSFSDDNSLTLFIIDGDNRVMGTLTDGDIRRALVKGVRLNDSVSRVANQTFMYLLEGNYDVKDIRIAKVKGIELLPVLNDKRQIIDVINLKIHKSYLPMDVVMMAGGKGERLRPLTEKTPKPLLQVGNKAIIDYNVERLISYGVKHINVTVNYLGEQIEEHFTTPIDGVKVCTVREPKFLGTMGSIQYVPIFYHDTVLMMNSDLFTNIDYEDFYLHFKTNDADMSIAAVPYTISIPYGIFELEGRDIKGVLEKPTYNYYANAGIYLIKQELLNLIPKDTFFNATDFMNLLMEKGYKVIRFPLNGTWIDIGNPQEYQKAKELVKHIK